MSQLGSNMLGSLGNGSLRVIKAPFLPQIVKQPVVLYGQYAAGLSPILKHLFVGVKGLEVLRSVVLQAVVKHQVVVALYNCNRVELYSL